MTVSDLDMEGILLTDLAQKVKDDLSQIGINVNIKTEAWAAGYGDDYRNGTLGFTVMYWGVDYSDPNVQLEFLPGGVVGKRAGWTADMNRIWQPCMKKPCLQRTMTRVSLFWRKSRTRYEHGGQAPSHIGYNTRLEGVAISDPYALDLTLIHVK
ncbi:MAG: ABC transporter substrate-binding protein [Lachnospiraceae bacterium]